jgi:malonyl CoA-acyl carrier protein transacylase
MICWIFPGQPISFADMPSNDVEFLEIAQLCQETTGFNPLEYGSSASNLKESVRLQLLGACISLSSFNRLARQGIGPDLIAEHSMGIYPALAASGSIDSATALALTCRIGTSMAEMGTHREYSMGCVIGLTFGSLQAIAENNGIHIANHNTSRHFLLAGERLSVESALVEAKASGAYSVRIFPSDAPLHTPMMEEIAGELHRIAGEYSYLEPRNPLIDHISQKALTAGTIPRFLADELCLPVYWETTYRDLRSRGATHFQEMGAGATLSKFNRWIDSETVTSAV